MASGPYHDSLSPLGGLGSLPVLMPVKPVMVVTGVHMDGTVTGHSSKDPAMGGRVAEQQDLCSEHNSPCPGPGAPGFPVLYMHLVLFSSGCLPLFRCISRGGLFHTRCEMQEMGLGALHVGFPVQTFWTLFLRFRHCFGSRL